MFCDSFHYDVADILQKWSLKAGTLTINPTGGRRGAPALRVGNADNHWVRKVVSASEYVNIGAAISVPTGYLWTTVPTAVLAVWGASAMHIFLELNSSGQLKVWRTDYTDGSVLELLGSSAAGAVDVTPGIFTHLELVARIHASAGTVEVRSKGDEDPLINLSGIRTKHLWADETCQGLGFGGNRKADIKDYPYYWDTRCGLDYCDIHLDAGATARPFRGNCRVDRLLLTADGTPQEWTPSAGNAWELLNADAGEYISSSTVSARSVFALADLTHETPAVHGLQVCGHLLKNDEGSRQATVLCKQGSTVQTGTATSLSTTETCVSQFYETDPDTSAAWTVGGINSAQVGVHLSA